MSFKEFDKVQVPMDLFGTLSTKSLLIMSWNNPEITYNLRYATKNGRQHGDPWSIRQSGVYHKFNTKTHTSVWILLQPSRGVYNAISPSTLHLNQLSVPAAQSNTLLLHLRIFLDSEREWRGYTNSLTDRLRSKVCNSSLRNGEVKYLKCFLSTDVKQ